MWVLILMLIMIMLWVVVFKEKTDNSGNILNVFLVITTILLVYALGQEIYFN